MSVDDITVAERAWNHHLNMVRVRGDEKENSPLTMIKTKTKKNRICKTVTHHASRMFGLLELEDDES